MKPFYRVFISLLRQFPVQLPLLLLGIVLMSALEGVGVLMIIPLGIALSENSLVSEGILARVTHFAQSFNFEPSLAAILIAYVLIICVHSFLSYSIEKRHFLIVEGFVLNLRKSLFSKTLFAKWETLSTIRHGKMSQSLISELDRVHVLVTSCISFISVCIISLVYLSISFIAAPYVTLFLIVFSIVFFYVARSRMQGLYELGSAYTAKIEQIYTEIDEQVRGLATIRYFSLAKQQEARAHILSQDLYAQASLLVQKKAFLLNVLKVIAALLIAIFLFVSTSYLNMQALSIVLLLVVFARLFPKLQALQDLYQDLLSHISSNERIHLLLTKLEQNQAAIIEDSPVSGEDLSLKLDLEKAHGSMGSSTTNQNSSNSSPILKIKNVSFQYQDSLEPQLKNVSIQIEPGEVISLSGISGVGKTTLLRCITGLLEFEGDITIDDKTFHSENASLLAQYFSVVEQEPVFFTRTVRDNLLLSAEKQKELNDDAVWSTLDKVQLKEKISSLPKKLDSLFGEGGKSFSVGERKRLALARALIHDAPFLILDEPFAGIDKETKEILLGLILDIAQSRGVLIITHEEEIQKNCSRNYQLLAGAVSLLAKS